MAAHKLSDRSRTADIEVEERVDFESLMLAPPLLKGLTEAGFERPSPIQLKAIPLGRCGLDLIAQAKSGTGKTCVFSVIALEMVKPSLKSAQVVILCPTREIAVQTRDVIRALGRYVENLSCHVFIGGIDVREDKEALKKCQIAVGTPGRVKMLIEKQLLSVDKVRLFIIDEADKMLDESFQGITNWIYSALPEQKQLLALSATYPEALISHLSKYMSDPVFVRLNADNPSLTGIKQYYYSVPSQSLAHKVFHSKVDKLLEVLSQIEFHQCVIFSNFQLRAKSLCDILSSKGWPALCISGQHDMRERLAVMEKLQTLQCRVLISTDLTARGIDAQHINVVINLDLPRDAETYLHRIGRAGRYGSHGIAITFVTESGSEQDQFGKMCEQPGICMEPLPDLIPKAFYHYDIADKDDLTTLQSLASKPLTQSNKENLKTRRPKAEVQRLKTKRPAVAQKLRSSTDEESLQVKKVKKVKHLQKQPIGEDPSVVVPAATSEPAKRAESNPGVRHITEDQSSGLSSSSEDESQGNSESPNSQHTHVEEEWQVKNHEKDQSHHLKRQPINRIEKQSINHTVYSDQQTVQPVAMSGRPMHQTHPSVLPSTDCLACCVESQNHFQVDDWRLDFGQWHCTHSLHSSQYTNCHAHRTANLYHNETWEQLWYRTYSQQVAYLTAWRSPNHWPPYW